ncbi:MAG: heterodisulfide reductase, partial [candidate division Zixibacteria bacterium]|nr:heterodisulfide reductase [candidate division Zixibacteria bacterium]
MGSIRLAEPDLDLIRDVKKAGGDTVNKCYQCATCSVVCNLSPTDKPFPRKEMLWTQWGQKDKLMTDPDIWLCHQCNDCTTRCPRGAKPGDVLAAIRTSIYKSFAFPSFMGNALASPGALPILLLVPVLLLLGCVLFFAPTDAAGDYIFMQSSQIDFDFFLPHSSVDALFVFGNILIFIFASVSFFRFWKGLKSSGGETKLSFVGALIKVAIDILGHSAFNKCETNKPRALGHKLLIYGFIGAMITTGAVFLSIFIPHYLELLGLDLFKPLFILPLGILNPFKILGVLSGIAILIGGSLLIFRRWT